MSAKRAILRGNMQYCKMLKSHNPDAEKNGFRVVAASRPDFARLLRPVIVDICVVLAMRSSPLSAIAIERNLVTRHFIRSISRRCRPWMRTPNVNATAETPAGLSSANWTLTLIRHGRIRGLQTVQIYICAHPPAVPRRPSRKAQSKPRLQ